jgi:hypothetical protein
MKEYVGSSKEQKKVTH